MNDIPIINLLPEKYRGMATLVVLVFPYVTRAFYSLSSGGGIVGMCRSVLFGTNTPK